MPVAKLRIDDGCNVPAVVLILPADDVGGPQITMKQSRNVGVSHERIEMIVNFSNRSIRFFGTPEEMTATDDRYIRDFLGGF